MRLSAEHSGAIKRSRGKKAKKLAEIHLSRFGFSGLWICLPIYEQIKSMSLLSVSSRASRASKEQ